MLKNRFRNNLNKFILINLIIIASMINCSKDRTDEDLIGFYLLLLQNPSNQTATSIITIDQRDFASYEGLCLDQFLGINVVSYYNIYYPQEIRNLPTKKSVLSDKPCALLGFSGGVENRVNGRNISMRSYTCSPQTSLCDTKAIREAGFSD
ncbi:LA_3150 family lipoprotein [Leptospira sp. GIMC2001]|uniref:LA_3150 family lipoprotein n=1 Tax=Leptospira sp. GIMC2001 TaxID=1513297 RepID=UPI00234ABB99|nr:hypothetical protein [Leptospira sp. GIMC2001]WCL49268.1 hypothetical protein O4O04_18540 [Leptospira sp. GIMC2001]